MRHELSYVRWAYDDETGTVEATFLFDPLPETADGFPGGFGRMVTATFRSGIQEILGIDVSGLKVAEGPAPVEGGFGPLSAQDH